MGTSSWPATCRAFIAVSPVPSWRRLSRVEGKPWAASPLRQRQVFPFFSLVPYPIADQVGGVVLGPGSIRLRSQTLSLKRS